jgi:hypothetical protein
VIAPRRGDTGVDPGLVTGLLGARALLGEIDALLAELADDGDRHAAAGPPIPALIDLVLGLAALSRLAAQRMPVEHGPAPSAAEPLAPIDLAIGELLR